MHDPAHSEESLREKAVRTDASDSQPIDLGSIWHEFVNGVSRAIDNFHSHERCYLVLESLSDAGPKGRNSRARKVRILESILLHGAQKSVAIELGLSPSLIAGASKECLEVFGLHGTASRISPLLIGAAHASHGDAIRCWGRVSEISSAGASYRVVSIPRPDRELAGLLTPAQYEVVRLFVEGKSHTEIAISRRRSTRTIANQLAASFRRLGVSGRSELIFRLLSAPGTAAIGSGALGRGPKRRVERLRQSPPGEVH